MGAAASEVLLVSAEPGATPSQCMCRLQKRFKAAEVREEQEREARLEEAQAAAKKAREYQSELEHRLQIQVCQPAAADRVVWLHARESHCCNGPCQQGPDHATLPLATVDVETYRVSNIPYGEE